MKRLVVAVLLLVGTRALADEERPWAAGVPEDRQTEALRLFAQGNDAYTRPDYAEAMRLYEEALKAWDHPAIRGNLAMALIHLDDPVRAYEEIDKALAYGKAPFEESVYEQLLTSQKLLLGQLGRVEIHCEDRDAIVTLDAETLIVGRGDAWRFVRTGVHQIVARKPRHLTFYSQVTALPNQPNVVKIVLVPLENAGGFEQRWKPWVPWSVLGVGVGFLAIGLGLELAAHSNIDGYEQEIGRSCPAGCDPSTLPPAVRALVHDGQVEHGIAIGAFTAGGIGVVAGGVLAYVNRPRRVHLDESGKRLSVAPLIGPGTAGLMLTVVR